MVLDPKNIVGPSTGESSNIAGSGYVTTEALPYLDFGGSIIGKSPGLTIAGRSPLSQGRFMSLKSPEQRSKIYSENVSSNINTIINDMKAQGYTQQSGTRLVKDLGGGTQSIFDIDPATGNTSSTQYTAQQSTSRSRGSSPKSIMERASSALSSKNLIISDSTRAKIESIANYTPPKAVVSDTPKTIYRVNEKTYPGMLAKKDSSSKNRVLPSFKIDPNHSRQLDQFLKRRHKW